MRFGDMVAGRCYLRHFIAIRSSFGRRNSVGLLFGNFIYCIISGLRFLAYDFQISPHCQAVTVVCHPKRTSCKHLFTHIFATRPHAIFSTLQGTQNPEIKPTLQRAKNANALTTHPIGRNSYQLHQDILSRRTTINSP